MKRRKFALAALGAVFAIPAAAKAVTQEPEAEEKVVAEKGDCKITISEDGIKFIAGENVFELNKSKPDLEPAALLVGSLSGDGGDVIIRGGNASDSGGAINLTAVENTTWDSASRNIVFGDIANPIVTIKQGG